MKSNRKINTVKLLDVVSIGGKSVREFDNELMYLSTGDLEESKIVNLEPVTFDSRPSRANQLVEINDILFAKMKDTRKTLLINENNKNIIVSTGFYVLRASNKVLPKYIYHYLNSDYFLNQKNKLCKGATQKAINNDGLKQIDIVLYDDNIQAKIVELLDKAQELIDKRKEQIEALDELVKSQFIEMFGSPSTNPKGWEMTTIGKITTDVRYGTSKAAVEGGKYPYLRMNNITYSGHLDLNNLKYIDIEDDELEKCIVRKGDVLFNRTNSAELIGKTCVFDLKEPMIIAGYIIRVRLINEVLPIYLSMFLNSDYGKGLLRGMAKGAVNQANINAQELKSIKIAIPPIELQNQFADFVKQTDKLKFEMEKSLKELEDNFNSLMQKSFKEELFN